MKNVLSQNLISLAEICPYPLYVVGGRVRDFLGGLKTEKPDCDICAPADTGDFISRAKSAGFKINAVYKHTGTVKIEKNGEEYEFSSFRSDEYIRGVHTPYKTFFTNDISLDARRRDFKCNAVYYDIYAGQFNDPLGGIADIKAKKLSTVAAADKVFGEDGLRLMRLARIAAQTGFKPDKDCMQGAKNNARLISDIAPERIYSELNGILNADLKYGIKGAQYEGLKILKESGVLAFILPELAVGDKMQQRADFHNHDVLEHTFRSVKYADKSIRLAALLHDAGKPYCMINYGKYHNHDTEGARIALDICARLRVPKKFAEKVSALVGLHMYDLDCKTKESKVRRFIVKNYEYFEELMLLKQADYSACKDDLSPAPTVVKMRAILGDMKKEGAPLTLKELAVKGGDLISAGVEKARIGETLEFLLYECALAHVANEREALLNCAVRFVNGCK
ncbi:MAG: HD domain-containing protein [Clostridia bacterium]|nr:HD domain-containing protein [Clostridia bacterium]